MSEKVRSAHPTRSWRWGYQTLRVFSLALVLVIPTPTHAVGPTLPKEQTADGSTPAPPSIDERTAAVRARLAQVRSRLSALPSDEAGAPPEAAPDEWAEHRRLLNLLGNAYENHLDSLSKLKDTRQSRQELQDRAAAWQGFPKPGPYPIDFVDDLWNQVHAKDREIESAHLEQAMFESLLEDQRLAHRNSGQALRKANELMEAADPSRRERARWLRDLSELRGQLDEARLTAFDTEREFRADTLAHRIEERELLQRKALAANQVSPLSAEQREAKLAELARSQRDLETETLRAAESDRRTQERLREARERLQATWGPVAGDEGRNAGRSQQELDILSAEAEVSGTTLKVLHLLAQALIARRQMWELRYRIEHTRSPEITADSLAQVQQALDRLTAWRKSLRSDLDMARRRVDGEDKRLADWNPEYGDRELGERKRLAYTRQEAVLRRAVAEADDLDATLRSLQASARLRADNATPAERLRALSAEAGKRVEQAWDFELLTVEDKIVAEGREIIGKRSVTVGKVVQVLLILGVGLWLTSTLAEQGRRLLTRWLPGRESAALLSLRLFTLVAVVGLVVFALLTVNIPLTVFTFVGGALAIGFGFGAQNILNNFISGLILLVERPIKLGDIVDVEGVRGRVTHIGSRCCQVRRFDGIDMLIPNSSFLEKNVTNWTLSDRHLRCTVTVGIAYGSPIRAAVALVERAAAEHPRTLKEPGPEVYLEEFGDNALLLRLDFWVDLVVEPNHRRVMSDLRQRIQELFDESGIVIAFPQRDIHLDSARPLQVELVAPETTARPMGSTIRATEEDEAGRS
jgi:potassium efflux system protein